MAVDFSDDEWKKVTDYIGASHRDCDTEALGFLRRAQAICNRKGIRLSELLVRPKATTSNVMDTVIRAMHERTMQDAMAAQSQMAEKARDYQSRERWALKRGIEDDFETLSRNAAMTGYFRGLRHQYTTKGFLTAAQRIALRDEAARWM